MQRNRGVAADSGVRDPGRYLGLPSMWGRLNKDVLVYIKNIIRENIQGWMSKTLNKAGKEVLIKGVITTVPSYVMNVFKLPETWCSEVNAMITDFLWGISRKGKKDPLEKMRRTTKVETYRWFSIP